jgi:pimeloyl-ACP methyl ester carboxylesterase
VCGPVLRDELFLRKLAYANLKGVLSGKELLPMKFYAFGDLQKPVILLLPGTCCHWKRNFDGVIALLEPDFYVICASYDGFDETEATIFPDMRTETEKIENFIQQHFDGHIFAAYGCSMGGSFVGLLMERQNIHIDHAILGSSDLDQSAPLPAMLKGWLVSKVLHQMFQTGKLPGWMRKRLDKKTAVERAYLEPMLKMFGVGSRDMAFVTEESIYNQFYSDLVTPLEDYIDVPGTTVHIFYATKMGEAYEKRYRLHFKKPDILRHNLQHEELLVCQPRNWAAEVRRCCGMKKEVLS